MRKYFLLLLIFLCWQALSGTYLLQENESILLEQGYEIAYDKRGLVLNFPHGNKFILMGSRQQALMPIGIIFDSEKNLRIYYNVKITPLGTVNEVSATTYYKYNKHGEIIEQISKFKTEFIWNPIVVKNDFTVIVRNNTYKSH